MEEDFYSPSLLASLLSSGTQGFPTPQPVQTAAYTGDDTIDPYTGLTAAQRDAQIAELMKNASQGTFDVGDPGIVPAWEQFNTPNYSASTMEYLSNLDKYIAQNDPAFGMMYSKTPTVDLSTPEKIRQYANYGIGEFLPEAQVAAAASQPFEQNVGFTVAPTQVGVGKNVSGALDVSYNTPVVLRDDATGQVVYQGTGFQGAQEAARLSNQLSATGDKNTQWSLLTGAPGATDVSQFNVVAQDKPDYLGGVLGALVQYGLPLGLSLIPGVGWAGSAALTGAGSTAGKLISGYDLDDALKSGLITAGTAALLKAPILESGGSLSGALSNAVGLGNAPTSAFDSAFDADYASWLASGADVAAPAFSGAVGGAGGTLGGSFAGTDAGGNFIQVLGSTAGSRIPASVLSGALSAAAAAPGLINYGNQVWGEQPSQGGEANKSYYDPVANEIVVPSGTTSFPIDPNSILAGFLGSFYPPLTSVNIPPLADTQLPELPSEEIPEGTGEDIVVNAPTGGTVLPPIPFPIANVQLPAPPLNSVTIPPGAGTTLPPTNNTPSLLDQIIKYVTVGGGIADLLGGQGGTRQPTTTPNYGSLLGGVPNFGRGAFTPFTGDYEKYAFGPEWNFFGGAPASTPTNG